MHWLDRTSTLKLSPHEPDLEDSTYLVPCFEDLAPLVESIRKVGVINPPLVQKTLHRGLIAVLGRRRLQAARQADVGQIEVRTLPPEMPEADGFRLAFWDNLGHRSSDLACTAYVVRRLLELFPRQVVARDFLPVLGIPPRGPRLARLQAVGGLEFTVLKALSSGRIHEKTAAILTALTPEDRQVVMELVNELRVNANKAAEIVDYLHDLSVLNGKAISELIRDRQCQSILHDSEGPVPDKAARFRELLRSWKFPEMVAREGEFDLWRRGLIDNDKIQIRPALGFETEECTIEIRSGSRLETESIVTKIKRVDS
ncbi:MAG: ParB N-terminal domain-containing protein [Desulfomonile tiedjei]|nr:ParB N-terminal domain-containing protein [Desulfomonile tiedjei]